MQYYRLPTRVSKNSNDCNYNTITVNTRVLLRVKIQNGTTFMFRTSHASKMQPRVYWITRPLSSDQPCSPQKSKSTVRNSPERYLDDLLIPEEVAVEANKRGSHIHPPVEQDAAHHRAGEICGRGRICDSHWWATLPSICYPQHTINTVHLTRDEYTYSTPRRAKKKTGHSRKRVSFFSAITAAERHAVVF